MAYSENKPKRSNWLLILIVLVIVALIAFYFLRGKSNPEVVAEAASDSSTVESVINANWSGVDQMNLPIERYDELEDTDIEVHGNEQYAIYSISEAVLFDSGQSQLKSGAEAKLERVANSAKKRYPDTDIRIFGHTDASGDQGSNKELAEARAEAVKSWLTGKGNVKAERISINPVGESKPVATNATAEGREKNRRVEIAIKKK
jgi:outer membrane protein OmpA-like peptidoglycan-associated protein